MLLNLGTLRSELVDLIKSKSITNTRRDRWLNQAQSDVAAEMDCEHLNVTKTFSSVANQRTYHFGFEFNKVLSLRDTTNNIDLTELTEGEIEEMDPDFSDTGTPYSYSITGMSWVENQPSSASVITIVSDSASDTTQTVTINGFDANNTEITETLSLNGLTPAVGTTSFTEITHISKSESTAGIVTATSNSAAVTVIRIPAAQLAKQYQPLNLYYIPSAINVYKVRGIRRPRMMISANDYPDFPEAYHELVLIGAVIRGHLDRFRPSLALKVRQELWEPLVKRLKGEMGNKRGKSSPVIHGSPSPRYGGWLGPDFPYQD